MNALANDQRDRLVSPPPPDKKRGGLLFELDRARSSFKFTVGQYIGETPEDEKDTFRNGPERRARAMPGELVFRSQMRLTPPNILLTNYSMLEYLLLRPDDSPLFDNRNSESWTFLVLDEAHQYRGAKGIEMAMLIRRLKKRLRNAGCVNKFRCIATSASLINEDKDRAAVAEFASALFDEPFEPNDVIVGESEEIVSHGKRPLTKAEYELLTGILDGSATTTECATISQELGVDLARIDAREEFVACLLRQDERTSSLLQLLSRGALDVADLARNIFPELSGSDGMRAASLLIQLCLRARDPDTEAPLLSARYHQFMRAMEGAFLNFQDGTTKLVLIAARVRETRTPSNWLCVENVGNIT